MGGAISGAVQLVVFFAVAVALLPQDIGCVPRTGHHATRTLLEACSSSAPAALPPALSVLRASCATGRRVTYYSAARTKMLGPWLKTLVMLLLPVPLLTWPLWAALGGLVVGARRARSLGFSRAGT